MEKKRYRIQFAARLMALLLVLSAIFTTALGMGKSVGAFALRTSAPGLPFPGFEESASAGLETMVIENEGARPYFRFTQTIEEKIEMYDMQLAFRGIYIDCTRPDGTQKHFVIPSRNATAFIDEYFDFTIDGEYTFRASYSYSLYEGSNEFYTYSTAVSYSYSDNTVQLPEPPTKEGHTFAGWYYDAEYTRLYDGEPITADTTLYAKFEINRYTVTFDSMGGSICEPVTVDWNTTLSDLPTPTKEGFDFMGWYIGETEYTGGTITADTTLTAKWQIQTFTVTFLNEDGSVYTTRTVEYGAKLADVMQEKDFLFYSVKSVVTADGTTLDNADTVTGELQVTVTKKTATEKVAAFFQAYWIWIVVGVGCLVVLGALFSTLAPRRRNYR